ncbi:hypothetical protein BJ742DRAFT_849781 [Cladochytrium replicatum]|nr:hypothetical protein BJ742DRAFT_849781 [Cladochytrium replicatum]
MHYHRLAIGPRILLKDGQNNIRLVCETLSKLMELWSTPNFVNPWNSRYHEYITEAIILSLTLVSSDELYRKDITAKMFHGLELRLGGLVKSIPLFEWCATAECFVATKKNKVDLSFRISPEEDETYKNLKELYSFDWKRVNEAPELKTSEVVAVSSEDQGVSGDAEEDDPDQNVDRSGLVRADDEEAGDDEEDSDLEPFDMSETAAALVTPESYWKTLHQFSDKDKIGSPYKVISSTFFVSLMNAAKNIGFSDDHVSRSLLQTLTFIITRSGADPSQPKMVVSTLTPC